MRRRDFLGLGVALAPLLSLFGVGEDTREKQVQKGRGRFRVLSFFKSNELDWAVSDIKRKLNLHRHQPHTLVVVSPTFRHLFKVWNDVIYSKYDEELGINRENGSVIVGKNKAVFMVVYQLDDLAKIRASRGTDLIVLNHESWPKEHLAEVEEAFNA